MKCEVCEKIVPDRKMRISIFAGILFLIIASPQLFKVMRQVLGDWVASPAGCPTQQGLLLHTVVFVLLTRLSMNY